MVEMHIEVYIEVHTVSSMVVGGFFKLYLRVPSYTFMHFYVLNFYNVQVRATVQL